MTDVLLSRLSDGVMTITNNQPETRNAISVDFYEGFARLIGEASGDPQVRVIVLTGAGGFFCSGGNINVLKERALGDDADRRAGVEALHDMIRAMRDCPKPIIAAIEGGAAGAGISLALACDLIVSARDAFMSAAHVMIGLTPDGGATAFLSQSLPRQLVNELCLTGSRITAERLHQFGIVNRLTDPGDALAAAEAAAHQLAAGPSAAMARIKALGLAGQAAGLDEQLEREAVSMATSLGGAEGLEGISAFLEKRRPDFRNTGSEG